MAKVLVTGGAGFIASYVVPKLLAQSFEVAVMDNLHPQVHPAGALPRHLSRDVEFFAGDVTIKENWASLMRFMRPEVVIHLAAETGTGQSLTEAHRHASVNVAGTALLLDALSSTNHKPARLILASSRAVYGDGEWVSASGLKWSPTGRSHAQLERQEWDYRDAEGKVATPLESSATATPTKPVSIYGATKLAQEHLLSCWCKAFDVPLTVFRFQNVYGPGQAPGNPYTGVVTFFVQQALRRERMSVYEDGRIIRDFVHVEDASDAIVAAVRARNTLLETLDIGSGAKTTILDVAKLVSELAGIDPPRVTGQFRDGDVRAASCSIEAAQDSLGYRPKWSLREGLNSVFAWARVLQSS